MNEARHIPHETLTAFLDGELTPVERSRVDAHLAECADCRATLASWAAVERDLDAATPALSDEDWNALAARVDRAIEAEERTATTARPSPNVESSWRELMRRLAPRPLAWSAAGAFATALLVVLLRPQAERFTPVENPAAISLPATETVSKETIASDDIARLEKKDAGRSDAAPSTGALTSESGLAKLEAERPPATTQPPAPALQQEAAPWDASADARSPTTTFAALHDSLVALDARRANAVKSPAAAPHEGFAKAKSLASSNEMRREAAGGGVSPERDAAAPDPLLTREIELVAALVATDAAQFCEEARARRARWESDAGFALLSADARARVAAIEAACPK